MGGRSQKSSASTRSLAFVQITRNEEDRDVHVALADPIEPTKTIVVEVVDPPYAATSPLLTTLSNAKAQYQTRGSVVGRQVRVRGVGFYDFAHGQTGRLGELHRAAPRSEHHDTMMERPATASTL
jgi:hypothetical protein